jgi:hypothetical protein
MPLPPPAARRHYQSRQINIQGYRREDGLWDIEGRLTDSRNYSYTDWRRGRMQPGDAIHDLELRLTIDDSMVVREVAAATNHAPYLPCFEVPPRFDRLTGLKIGGGWRKAIRERLGGAEGCTHMLQMLDVMATVAFQTLALGAEPDPDSPDRAWRSRSSERPRFLNTCHAWATDGSVVQELLPQYFEPKKPESEGGGP